MQHCGCFKERFLGTDYAVKRLLKNPKKNISTHTQSKEQKSSREPSRYALASTLPAYKLQFLACIVEMKRKLVGGWWDKRAKSRTVPPKEE